MKKKKLAIIHFHPVEFYPPIHNLVNYIGQEHKENFYLHVFTTALDQKRNQYKYPSIKVHRTASRKKDKNNKLLNILKIAYTYAYQVIQLLFIKPDVIIYYDSISAFAPYVISRYFKKTAPIFIHYHEFLTDDDYLKESKLMRLSHKIDTKLYRQAKWISQTNQDRLNLFYSQYQSLLDKNILHTLPNYPPKTGNWKFSLDENITCNTPIRLVYVGSISYSKMYFKEIFHWIKKHNGRFILDIYSFSQSKEFKENLRLLDCNFINLKGAVSYDDLPSVLRDYDIGLVAYKATKPNIKYCISNKIYEYLAAGLDVWATHEMVTTKEIETKDTYPKVILIDFSNLMEFNWEEAVSRKKLKYKPQIFHSEDVFRKLMSEVSKAIN